MNQKLPQATIDRLCEESNDRYFVQTGYEKGPYETRRTTTSLYVATVHYRSILTHSGYKKRIVDTVEGTVIERYLS